MGAITLVLGIVLLIIGAASHIAVVVIGGLVAGAWGIWRLVTGTGNNAKPPGQTSRVNPTYGTTQFSCFQYASRSPSFVPTMTAMTFCWLSLLAMMGWLLVLVYSAMLPDTVGAVLWKSDSHSVRKSVNLLLVVQSRLLLNSAPEEVAEPGGGRGRAGDR